MTHDDRISAGDNKEDMTKMIINACKNNNTVSFTKTRAQCKIVQ